MGESLHQCVKTLDGHKSQLSPQRWVWGLYCCIWTARLIFWTDLFITCYLLLLWFWVVISSSAMMHIKRNFAAPIVHISCFTFIRMRYSDCVVTFKVWATPACVFLLAFYWNKWSLGNACILCITAKNLIGHNVCFKQQVAPIKLPHVLVFIHVKRFLFYSGLVLSLPTSCQFSRLCD